MKIKVDREHLADKLKKAMRFIPSKSLVSAQENFRCTVKDNMMEIIAADSQCQVKLYCPVKADMDGAFCVEASIFLKTINLFRENEVLITKKSDTVIEMKSGKSKYKVDMDCMPDDFPMMPIAPMPHEISMLQNNLKTGLKFTEKFIDDKKSAMIGASGININNIDNRMVFTGLDQHILARVSVSPLSIVSWQKNAVLPCETAIKVLSLLNNKGEISMFHNDDKIMFSADDSIERFEITSLLVNTKYPNSEGLFSKKSDDHAIINTLEIKDAFMRLNLYIGDDKVVHVKSNPENLNELTLTATNTMKPKGGEESVTIKNICGKPINKGFNPGSMLKVLANIESNEFMFFFHENNKVASFIQPVPEGEDDSIFNFLISATI